MQSSTCRYTLLISYCKTVGFGGVKGTSLSNIDIEKDIPFRLLEVSDGNDVKEDINFAADYRKCHWGMQPW